ncbi:hypothetical protein AX15_001122 [Amanita polypyramis BW_CC]|nr:hypothetical protein AX15_001122 [Amanita polypyramis BW_CC]
MTGRIVKVAVIGSGLTGLTAAYLLTNPLEKGDTVFEVHLYEKESKIGMDSSSIDIAAGDKVWRIDVPMRSFQGGYYPQLISFYRKLGVSFRKCNFSYSFSTLACSGKLGRIRTTMIYNGLSGLAGISMPSGIDRKSEHSKDIFSVFIYKTQSFWVFLAMALLLLFCYLRLLCYAIPVLRPDRWKTLTFSAWVAETVPTHVIARLLGLDVAWKDFTHSTLLPLFSAVCTAPKEDVLSHPVEEILDYVWLTLGTNHFVVVDGVQNVILRLKSRIPHTHLSSVLTAVEADRDNSKLASITYDQNGDIHVDHGFHHVIFATEANRATSLLSAYVASLPEGTETHRGAILQQLECLSSFKYCTSTVLNHTDRGLLPENDLDVRDLNLIVSADEQYNDSKLTDVRPLCVSPSFTMATHVMWPPKGYPVSRPIYQTTNAVIPPKMDCLLSYTKLERAVLTLKAKEALKGLYRQQAKRWWRDKEMDKSRLGALQGAGRLENDRHPGIWICGSYAYPGIPLLEGCVVSSRIVVEEGIFQCEGVAARRSAW